MKRPNLLIVFPDQMRGQAMGFLNEEPVKTPTLDRFASEGLVLDNVSATYPLCSPFRAMLMTGRYPHANRVTANCTSRTAPYNVELQASDRCWSDILKDRGYSLGYIGKWHLDAPHEPYIDCYNNEGATKWNEWCPPDRRHGFDFWYAYGTYDRHNRPMYWRTDAAREEYHFVDQWGPEHEADLAIEYLHNADGTYRDPDRPFGLVVSMNPPHMPYDLVPERYVQRYEDLNVSDLCLRPNVPEAGTEWGDYYRDNIRHYFAMITGVDAQFGRILGALEEAGLAEDTIVVFTSDHGNCLGIHNHIAKNNHYEESIRVPFIIRWPGRIPHRRDDLLLSAPDLYPTLMNLMDLDEDIPETVEGSNYADILLGGEGSRPTSQLYMKVDPQRPAEGMRGIRTGRYTLVVEKEGDCQRIILHDNVEDPYQLRDIAKDRPELVSDLLEALNHWLRRTNDPWIEDTTKTILCTTKPGTMDATYESRSLTR